MKSKAQVSAKEVSDRLSDATGPLDIVFIVAELFESATTDTERSRGAPTQKVRGALPFCMCGF